MSLFLFGAIVILFFLMWFILFHIILLCNPVDFGASVHRLGDIYLFGLQCHYGKPTFAVRQNLCRAFYFGRMANVTFTVRIQIRRTAKKKRRAKKIFVVHLKKTHGASPKNTHQRGARARNDMRGTTVNDLSREPHVPRPLPCVPRRRTTKFQKNCDYLPSFYLSTANTLPFTLYFNYVLISIILLFLTNFFR
jgi:hypothetical protein